MSGITDLETLLACLDPVLCPARYAFRSCGKEEASALMAADGNDEEPFAFIREEEGWTVILPLGQNNPAAEADSVSAAAMKRITLNVHSSLEAVGLTAHVSRVLAGRNISANVVAGFYHDHIFVPEDRAEEALAALTTWPSCRGGRRRFLRW